MINKQFLTLLVLVSAFFIPSLGQAWSFIETEDSLSKSGSTCWQVIKVQDESCVGENCPDSASTELPPAEDEEPDCE